MFGPSWEHLEPSGDTFGLCWSHLEQILGTLMGEKRCGPPKWIQNGGKMDSKWIQDGSTRPKRFTVRMHLSVLTGQFLTEKSPDTPQCTVARTGAGGFSRQSRWDRPHRENYFQNPFLFQDEIGHSKCRSKTIKHSCLLHVMHFQSGSFQT